MGAGALSAPFPASSSYLDVLVDAPELVHLPSVKSLLLLGFGAIQAGIDRSRSEPAASTRAVLPLR